MVTKRSLISADNHVFEPVTLWQERLPAGFRDRGPRVEQRGDWIVMAIEGMPDRKLTRVATTVGAGGAEGGAAVAVPSRESSGGSDLDQRLRDMALDGVVAEVIYPTFGLFIDMIPAADLQMACARVYNDWLAEAFLARPDVFIPAAVVPVRDVASAVAELGRVAALGFKAAMIPTSAPAGLPYNRAEYDPLWRIASDAGMPLSLHTGTGALPQHERGPGGAVINYAKVGLLSAETLCYFCASGALERFPDLKLVFVETGAGWFAYCCERMDEAFEEHEQWVNPKLAAPAEPLREDAVPRDPRRRPRAAPHTRDHRDRAAVVGERLSASRRHVPAQPGGRRAHLRGRAGARDAGDRRRQRRPFLRGGCPDRLDAQPACGGLSVQTDGAVVTLKDETAIVGVGSTPYYRRGESVPQTSMELAGKAVLAALDDAGLTADDLDGFALYSMGFDTSLFAQWLGVPEVRFTAMLTGGGGGAAGSVGLAAAAIVSGMAECVVSVMTLQQAASRFGASFAPRGAKGAVYSAPPSPEANFAQPSGLMAPGQMFAVLAQRHMHLYGTKREHFCEVAISTRNNAIRRPTSLMQDPLTRDDYFAARMISDPLCLYDFCLECDGAVAVVTTSAERARDLRHPPVRVIASAHGGHGRWGQAITWMGMPDDEFVVVGAPAGRAAAVRDGRHRARRRRRRADLRPLQPDGDHAARGLRILRHRRGRPVRRRRQHPLARRVAAGEHARRQPVGGVHHRHDAREGSRRAVTRHGREPGRRRRGRARHRRTGVDPGVVAPARERPDDTARRAAARRHRAHAEPVHRAVLGRGRASTGSCCRAARRAAPSGCRRRRSAGSAATRMSSGSTHDGKGTLYWFTVIRHAVIPQVRDALPLIAAVVELPGTGGCRLIGNIVDCEPEDVAIGAPVELDWYDVREGTTIPVFRL